MADKIGIILGSGLNKFTEELSSTMIISEDSDTFHKMKVMTGKIENKEIVLFSGRRHFYEGYSVEEVISNVDTAKSLGVNLLIITNAAGGLNKNFKVSDLMLITSHMNILNNLIPTKNNSVIYDDNIINKVKAFAKMEKIRLRTGTYFSSRGPMYETKSEIRFLSTFGIDAVGMSTIPEIIYAKKIPIKCIAISCITNLLSENSETITDHDEVLEAGNNAYVSFSKLLKEIISKSSEIF